MGSEERIFRVSEVIFQQILAVFLILVIWEATKYSLDSKGTWHIIMSVIGVALLMAEGVQIFRKESTVTYGDTREEKQKVHLLVMVLGFTCITIGISLKISQKEDWNRSHFDSTHGSLGLATWIMAFFTALGGLMATDMISMSVSHRLRKLLHIILGISTYIVAIFTLGYGLQYLGVGDNGRIFLYILLSIYVLYSLIGPCKSVLNLAKS